MMKNLTFLGLISFCCLAACLPRTVWAQDVSPAGQAPFAPVDPLPQYQMVRSKEDWSKLKAGPTSFEAVSSAILGQAENANFSREIVRVQWRADDPIDLFIIKPRGARKPPVILYLYGYPSTTDRFFDDGWCKRATQDGAAAVGFVSALTGDRYRDRPMKEWFVSELQESLGKSTHDVQMILNYLEKRDDLDMGRVGMWGQGSGGTIALLAAEADPRIRAVDAVDPWGDWPDWLKNSPQVPENERPAYITPEFLKKVETLDPVWYLPTLKTKSLRVEQDMTEHITPQTAKEKIGAAVPKAEELVRYKDEWAHLAAWRVDGLSGWLVSQLDGTSRPATQQKAAPTTGNTGGSSGK